MGTASAGWATVLVGLGLAMAVSPGEPGPSWPWIPAQAQDGQEQGEQRALEGRPESQEVRSRELERRVARLEARLEELEGGGACPHLADHRAALAASSSVVFLQISYGFRDPATGEPLRFRGFRDGRPMAGPDGLPAVTVEPPGPRVERHVTGTAFVVGAEGLLLTNRHVARPWEHEKPAQDLVGRGYEPRLERVVAYLPGFAEGQEAETVVVSEEVDLAVLVSPGLAGRARPLELAGAPPAPGEPVVVLGYPIGIQALLGRADPRTVDRLLAGEGVNFWSVARRLSREGRILPLATHGIVGQVSEAAVVYDARTARGGSGGPVLDALGRVVAINAVVLPDFLGANMGVPVTAVDALLKRARDILAPERGNEKDGRSGGGG